RATDRVELRVGLQHLAGVGRRVARVAAGVALGERVLPGPDGVAVAEPVAPIVAGPAVLRLAALGFEGSVVGPGAEVAALDVAGLARLDGFDLAAAVAVGAVDPAVEAVLEAVDEVLRVPLSEAGEQDLAMVGLAVAVAVLGIDNVRGRGDEHALLPG